MEVANRLDLFFIGGIHGVGKTTIAKELAKQLCGKTFTASQLIKEARHGDVTWAEDKRVKEIPQNQKLLLSALKERTINGELIVLDGHFTLFDEHGNIERIAANVFDVMSPRLFMVILDEPHKISMRLNERDGMNHNVELLKRMQKVELEHARRVSAILNINLLEFSPSETDKMIELARNYISVNGN